ncbi:MAG TPA: hypothetical protein VK675_03580 [Candidatus Paceibacterota bacterium]|nr:hypothetical protein [Candidatus Paceibacterota bacterium]
MKTKDYGNDTGLTKRMEANMQKHYDKFIAKSKKKKVAKELTATRLQVMTINKAKVYR